MFRDLTLRRIAAPILLFAAAVFAAIALFALPAFAEVPDLPSAAPAAEKRIADLEQQVTVLSEQVKRADAIIAGLSRQRNEAMERVLLMETRALTTEAIIPKDAKK